jgi:nucleoside-diphosphate-sugar epimerase
LRSFGIEPVLGDILEPASLAGLPLVESVLYAVGYDRHGGRSKRDVYVAGVENVLHAIVGKARRLIYVSSTSVYGQDDGSVIDEASETNPTTESGQFIVEAEALVRRQGGVLLRSAGIYGPGRLLRRVGQLRSREPIAANPDGWLNLVHVDDLARAVLAAEDRAETGTDYIVCDDRPVRRREYYGLLAELVGAPPPVFDPAVDPRPLGKRCSNRKLRAELGVELAYPTIAEGLPAALRSTVGE